MRLMERSVGAVVFRERKELEFLLLRYGAGHWDFVKGNREKGERSKETLLRELKEETNLQEVELVDGFKERITYFFREGGGLVLKEVVFYLARLKNGEVQISFEHTDFGWFSYEECLKTLTFKTAKDVLKKAHNYLIKEEG